MTDCTRYNKELAKKLIEMSNEQLLKYALIHISYDSADLIRELAADEKAFEKRIRIRSFPSTNSDSICAKCTSYETCNMNILLDSWYEQEALANGNPTNAIFKEYYIDDPKIEDHIVTWCPYYNV